MGHGGTDERGNDGGGNNGGVHGVGGAGGCGDGVEGERTRGVRGFRPAAVLRFVREAAQRRAQKTGCVCMYDNKEKNKLKNSGE